ncbi:hypothetical protein GCM10022419_026420 [Nonomuraea rosea]|uniref:PE domain-containing protein n=1 Tax=Nonomuraea rosea TaxID=638574 RepID=A0ABP6W205_9ACTN
MTGYRVDPGALRRESAVYEERQRNAERARDDLRAAFDRDRNTLGNDEYGAELAKQLPQIEAGLLGGLQAYVDELAGIAGGLRADAGTYEQAGGSPTGGS